MWIVEISDLLPLNQWDEGLDKMKNRAQQRPVERENPVL
tara:strand:- start:186 stop:302 length:117 start_codon:yes stop_codon:yes gene_type:complete